VDSAAETDARSDPAAWHFYDIKSSSKHTDSSERRRWLDNI